MPISFACPHCSRKYQVADTMAGKAVKCQSCDKVVHVPSAQQTAPITFSCQSCGKQYQVAAGMAGKQAKCQSCQAIMQVPASNAAAGAGGLGAGGGLNSLFDEVTENDLARWQPASAPLQETTYSPHTTSPSAGGQKSGPKPKNYLMESVLCFLFCGGVLAIPAIIAATQVDSKYKAGDYEGAVAASNSAKKRCLTVVILWPILSLIGIVVGLAMGILGAVAS